MANVFPLDDMEAIPKTSLSSRRRVPYMSFRKNLTPRYARVFFDILFGYVFLGAGVVVPIVLWRAHPPWVFPLCLVSALSTGYWIAYLLLFIHEAAHFNIAPAKKWNDFLSNLLIGSWAGQNTASYRTLHWDHHRFLGRINDTEHSYFDPLNLWFFVKTLSGIAAVQVLFFRRKHLKTQKTFLDKIMPLAGLALQGSIAGILFFLKAAPFAGAWAAGAFLFFPFFGALRQLLEHRGDKAKASFNYTQVPHGKHTRIFREGPIASTFGAAGFTRHLIHHWDPQISYTRLGEVETFLMETRLKQSLNAVKTTYRKTFFRLLEL